MSQTSDLQALLAMHMASRHAANMLSPDDYDRVSRTARDAVRMAKKLHRLAEVECNHGLSPRQEIEMARLETKVRTALEWYGLTVKFNGDPRGFPVLIHGLTSKSGCVAYNTWGGAGHGYGIG